MSSFLDHFGTSWQHYYLVLLSIPGIIYMRIPEFTRQNRLVSGDVMSEIYLIAAGKLSSVFRDGTELTFLA